MSVGVDVGDFNVGANFIIFGYRVALPGRVFVPHQFPTRAGSIEQSDLAKQSLAQRQAPGLVASDDYIE
ncbi:hypothetical protein GCM10007392_16230 [Saccharospirillum salsuginis]|uniref:Uncharacterized protein n=1 Tax=Saccharospirillum salsuginis TaxID=418750 RepID=A0A918N8V0_9GAMM|nr:hypothetical protein GCM10007392_16230 [Saccharospirillum salsuginis]